MADEHDTDRALKGGGLREVFEVLYTARQRWHWRSLLDNARRRGDTTHIPLYEKELAAFPEVSPLEGIAAATRLGPLTEDARTALVIDAREQGATWAKVAAALNVTSQSAWEKYHAVVEANQD